MTFAQNRNTCKAALAIAAATLALLWLGGPRAEADETAALRPVMACAALAELDFTPLETRIASAAVATRNAHTFCDVKGYISPATQFEALLPEETWRGDYLQQGCGGLCGKADVNLEDPSRTSGYQAPYAPLADGEMVVAADDQGHEAPNNGDALWARSDLRLRVVFGYTSEHQLAQAMQAIIRAYYGRRPSYSYFSGVSDGGHEALDLAQRYPEDFDGIIAGAPANNWAALTLFETWLAASNRDAQGRQILTAEKLPALHAAVMAACANPQGYIADPRACAFNPASLRCQDKETPACLTEAQIRVVRDEYRGPTDAVGDNLFDGGEPYGSELAWAGWLVMPAEDAAAPGDTYAAQVGLGFLNEMAFLPNHRGRYGLDNVPFSVEMHQQLQQLGGIYNATDPDLSAFRAHGGKLIIYHSWADQAIPPFASLDYYRAVVRAMGGLPAAQAFSRLYMIPGLYHCPCGQPVDGDPATTVQFMSQLVDWVEHDKAPGSIALPVTSQSAGEHQSSLTIEPFDVLATAPGGDGLNSNYRYVGAAMVYRSGNTLWCDDRGPVLTCPPVDRRR